MTGGRKRVWIWRRRRQNRTAKPPEAPPATEKDRRAGTGATPAGSDPQASLDQVLRRAAETRDVERRRDD